MPLESARNAQPAKGFITVRRCNEPYRTQRIVHFLSMFHPWSGLVGIRRVTWLVGDPVAVGGRFFRAVNARAKIITAECRFGKSANVAFTRNSLILP